VEEVARENETGYLPTLKTKIERIEQYLPGLPYLGNPIPHECGLRRRSSFQTVREHCPQSTVVQGFVIRGGLEEMDNICYQNEQGRRKHRKKLRAG